MREIIEKKEGNEKWYDIYINSQQINSVKILKVSKEYNGFRYIFLLFSSGIVIEDVFYYLNYVSHQKPINTREVYANALKLLYSYLEIRMITISEMKRNNIKELSDFIIGIDIDGNLESYQFITRRSVVTHNLYFNAIREYLNYLGINNNYIFETYNIRKHKGGFGVLGHTKEVISKKYSINKTIPLIKKQFVPKYISMDEFKKIMNEISECKTKNKLRDKLILLLMYCRGLRIGEVLGITLEDIKAHPYEKNAGIIILRNRTTDKKYQFAKTCMKVNSIKDYNSPLYKEEDFGYQQIIIQPILMDIIKQYIDLSRDIFSISDTLFQNINNKALADVVEGEVPENYYLFLNKNGTPLSSSGWRKILINYFNIAGIPVDKKIKKNNLSHRFRHGYAMYLILVEKRSIDYVQAELRHKSILSTQRYFNPTEDDILKATRIVQKDLIEIIERIKNE